MLVHPNFDPVVFSLGPVAVRWYGLMYLAGFAAGWWLGAVRISKGHAPIDRVQLDVWWTEGTTRHAFSLEGFRRGVMKPGDVLNAAP